MQNRQLKAVVFTHVPFEDLGSLQPCLLERGFAVESVDISTARFPLSQTDSCDLLVVLGGPIGVYESASFPFLNPETESIRQRLEAQKPTLGICLGAQLIAAALGSRVYPGDAGPEIGWSTLHAPGGHPSPAWFQPLLAPGLEVLHWHADTFDLPLDSTLLASTQLYPHQAFTIGNFALSLQFHPEVNAAGLERWYVGHAAELQSRGISIPSLRAESQRHASALAAAAEHFWNGWLDSVFPLSPRKP